MTAPTPVPAVRTAPYALVRATTLGHPAQSADGAGFRAGLERLTRLERALRDLLPALTEALYASRGGHPDSFHRTVVLPLRRALHNGREPRPALLDALGDLPERVPRLREWLELRDRLAAARADLAGAAPAALAAERAALAAQCREPALLLAASATSAQLLAAIGRAGSGATGRRARKEEPGVLRHALRAATRSSPVSWFTAVGWGPLTDDPEPAGTERGAEAEWGEGAEWGHGDLLGATGNHVRTGRSLVAALCEALLTDPARRARLPHRMTSAPRTDGAGRAVFARRRGLSGVWRFTAVAEDEVAVAASGALERVAELCRTPVTPGELAAALAAPRDRAAALAYVERLADTGLLVPVPPVGPQDPDPLGRLAAWLRSGGEGALASSLDEIADATRKFGAGEPAERAALLALLRERWAALLASAGRPLPPDEPVPAPLTEDVVARRPVAARGLLTGEDREALREVAALAELYDLGHLVRRYVRDRFVARYGPGGVCHPVWEFGGETVAAWEDTVRDAFLPPGGPDPLPSRAAELVRLRRSFEAAAEAGRGGYRDPDADVVLPPELVRSCAARLPGWASARPLSYAHFLQRDAESRLLVLNHVYGGWGRTASRFLSLLDPGAAEAVGREVERGAEPGSRAVQFRPVQGFNANLQPRFLRDEILSEEHGPATRPGPAGPEVDEAGVELFHDEAADQVRLRLRDTGEPLDVFYPGLLVSGLLPTRCAPLAHDHPEGVVGFASLVPQTVSEVPGGPLVRTPRLRHRHVVLRRRRWKLAPGTVAVLRADLAAEAAGGAVPFGAAARWRALLGVPGRLFLHPPVAADPTAAAARAARAQPKPQFVDLGNALHLRCLDKWLARHPEGLVLEEALPAPGGRERPARAVELVVETYRPGSSS
ncbi:lantibiotic dehydratase [Streptomyces racemochromogenes]|uniref:Lantibiotic dehydratase n=1 Tax=Streptomyces racemochromogenes TaxID=67353 RepID=A0ABW7PHR7_9ACTN